MNPYRIWATYCLMHEPKVGSRNNELFPITTFHFNARARLLLLIVWVGSTKIITANTNQRVWPNNRGSGLTQTIDHNLQEFFLKLKQVYGLRCVIWQVANLFIQVRLAGTAGTWCAGIQIEARKTINCFLCESLQEVTNLFLSNEEDEWGAFCV